MHNEKTTPRSRGAGKWLGALAGGMAVAVAAGLLASAAPFTANAAASQAPAACVTMPEPGTAPPPEPGEPQPTTVTTLEQAYWCILTNYYSGPVLDNRELLVAAFRAFTLELQRRGLDRPTAITPAFTGDRAKDWTAFGDKYSEVLATLPDDATLRQDLAITTLKGMLDSLHDDHAHLSNMFAPTGPGPGKAWGLGVHTQPVGPGGEASPEKTAPLYLDFIFPGSPAEAAGLKVGDIIAKVNDVPPYVNGVLAPGVLAWLYAKYPSADKVRVTVQRPATGKTWTVNLTPAAFPWGVQPSVPAKLVDGGIAQVELKGFFPDAAAKVREAIENLRKDATLRGIVLDLRGNGGGDPAEVTKLLSNFIHDAVWGSFCDVRGNCTPNRTDTTTPLLNLPLVVLTDRNCASACDAFSNAVKDFKLGPLVGARTAGIVSGPAGAFLLNDNTTLLNMPKLHGLGPNGEVISGIGVPPDYFAPMTAADLSTRRDPGVAKALELLKH